MHRRPTAFEVSFPEEVVTQQETLASRSKLNVHGSPVRINVKKRKNDLNLDSPTAKRRFGVKPKVAYYQPRADEIRESKDLDIVEEDPDINEDGTDKPIRVLSNFSIFDPKHENQMVSLSALEEDDGLDREVEGAGLVTAYFHNDEDEGQEDGIPSEGQYVRLGAILLYKIDYLKRNDPVYIETSEAWYLLRRPSQTYKPFFRHFYFPRRIAQLVIASASMKPRQGYRDFLDEVRETSDPVLGYNINELDITYAISEIEAALEELDDPRAIRASPVVRHLLSKSVRTPGRRRIARHDSRPVNLARHCVGNLDLAVLQTENQNPTHVTPLIASLLGHLVRERLVVVGPPPTPLGEGSIVQQQKNFKFLHSLIVKAATSQRQISIPTNQRRLYWLQDVEIDGEMYSVGDVVLVPIGNNGSQKAPEIPNPDEIPPEATLAGCFWFGKIIWINPENNNFHVQWFEHDSRTFLEEVMNPKRLVLTDLCDTLDLEVILGKVTVHYSPKNESDVPEGEFFYRSTYDRCLGEFVDVDIPRTETAKSDAPPNNCPVCLLVEHRNHDSLPVKVGAGVAFEGNTYHRDDFVMIRAEAGPCFIGYISDIKSPLASHRNAPWLITVRRVGRISDLADILPITVLRDERHLYLTNEIETFEPKDIIRPCFVLPRVSIDDLPEWLSQSPDHFHITYRFSSLKVHNWSLRQEVSYLDLHLCHDCYTDKIRHFKLMKKFVSTQRPLKVLDLFGGVGAFSIPLVEALGCAKVTHAIEISPSAAKTFKRNSPETVVYNQCANIVLKYSIKTHEGHQMDNPMQLYNINAPLPAPLKPGDVDIIVIGFPCQSHSDLNMYKKADDIKSNLILNALAWVDFLKPQFVIFENVRGFLSYNMGATQAGQYRVEGGVEMGGLKSVTHAMVSMNYQVRPALLQAGHYGTPQTRVRFFLIAAKQGFPLPQFPQPTHDFPPSDSLEMKFPNGDKVRPIMAIPGTAPHPSVTVDDAISDLLRFDWKNPRKRLESAEQQREGLERRNRNIAVLPCDRSSPWCGFEGAVRYEHEPKTTYQARSRLHPTEDLQHYTRCLLPKKVERVVTIPLIPNADYRYLRPDLYEYQFANPSSAVAKAGYRPGLYGRIDPQQYFNTTVTNMDPTAKQSRVLNPYCKRIVTVRELARSQGFPDNFVFKSINKNVVTMHRQIGNAVPWLVASALGREIRVALFNKWSNDCSDAILVD